MLGVLGRVGTGVRRKQKPAPRDLKGGHLSLANSGRGLHPAASPPACCTPTLAAARWEWI